MEQENKNIDPEKTGKFIAELRKAHNLTQDELGDILFISRKSVSKWETGRACPSIDMLKKLSENFGVSLNDLINGNFDETIFMNKKASLEKTLKVREYKTSAMFLCTLFFSILFMFFQYEANRTKVYYIKYQDENFVIQNGVLVLSMDEGSNINLSDLKINSPDLFDKDFSYSLYYVGDGGPKDLFKFNVKETNRIDKNTSRKLREILDGGKGKVYLKISYINYIGEEVSYNLDIFRLYVNYDSVAMKEFPKMVLGEYIPQIAMKTSPEKEKIDSSLNTYEEEMKKVDLEFIFNMSEENIKRFFDNKKISVMNEIFNISYKDTSSTLYVFNEKYEFDFLLNHRRLYVVGHPSYSLIDNNELQFIDDSDYILVKKLIFELCKICNCYSK